MIEPDLLEREERLKAHLVALEAFVGSQAHVAYKAAKQDEVDILSQQILDDEITDIASLFRVLNLRGQLAVTRDCLTQFEVARTNLIADLEQISEQKQQLVTKFNP